MPKRPECQWCHDPATRELVAQWTLFDWLEFQCCDLHVTNAVREAERTFIDGQPFVEARWHYYEDPARYAGRRR